MTDGDLSKDFRREFLRETEFLVRMIPALDAVRRKDDGWEGYGRQVGEEAEKQYGRQEGMPPLWDRAKRAVASAALGGDGATAAIRMRITKQRPVTPTLHSELSLWLAGEIGVSVTVTKRLCAAMLIGVASAHSDWRILARDDAPGASPD